MYRIVIADDEPFIIKGLKVMVDWEKLDVKIVGEAENGKKLLQLIDELKPDIVISDIEMPELKGLDIIRTLKERGISTKVILLSAYQEFSYAKDAITYGAIDYLVKPVLKEDLIDSIKKAQAMIRKEDFSIVVGDNTEEKSVIVGKNENIYHDRFKERLTELQVQTEHRVYVGACFSLAEETVWTIDSNNKFELLRFAIFKSIQDYVEKNKYGMILKRNDKKSSAIFSVPEDNFDAELIRIIKGLREELYKQYKAKIIVGIGDASKDIGKINYIYKTAKFSWGIYYFWQQDIIYYKNINKEYTQSVEELEKESAHFIELIINRNGEWIDSYKKCLDFIENIHYGNRYAAENRCILLVTDLYRELTEYKMITEEEKINYEEFIGKIRFCTTYKNLRKYTSDYLKEFMDRIYRDKMKEDTPIIRSVKQYINEHYKEDIKLSQIAKIAYMNPYYFSSFFKKETGQNFKHYLLEVRMKEAKKLLFETDMKTYEIAKEVGYNDVRSFTDKFREVYGGSPSSLKKEIKK